MLRMRIMHLSKGSAFHRIAEGDFMKILRLLIVMILSAVVSSTYARDFYASKELLHKYPEAFALSPQAISFHAELESKGKERRLLVQAIAKNSELYNSLLTFDSLSLEKQI